MYDWLTDAIGPLAAGVLLLGVVPAVVLIIVMTSITRMVEWRASRAPSLVEDGEAPA